jgi:hypothetical protein
LDFDTIFEGHKCLGNRNLNTLPTPKGMGY